MACRARAPSILLIFLCVLDASVSARLPNTGAATKYVLVLFGDSLTDTGNTFTAAGVPDPTVYVGPGGEGKGRFCNGLNWVDYLTAHLKATLRTGTLQVFNYAYGAATACASPLTEAFAPFVKNLTSQTELFLTDVKTGKIALDKDTKVLVIQWIGTVDMLNALNDAARQGRFPSDAEIAALVASTVTCRVAAIQALAAAQISVAVNVAVIPISPLRLAPTVPPVLKPKVQELEVFVGQQTAAAVQSLRKSLHATAIDGRRPTVTMHMIGRNANWIARGVDKVKPAFKYTDVPCFFNPNSSLVITPNTTTCANPNDYLFYDAVHVTTRFHEWFAMDGLLPRLQNMCLLPHP